MELSEKQVRESLMRNDVLEQLILCNWKKGDNPATAINIPSLASDIAALLASPAKGDQ